MFDKRVKLIKSLVFVILFFVLRQPVFAGVFEIQDMAIGTAVRARGVVIAEPGVLGQQIFYINGAQIYSYYKDFPELATGDEISVQGVISQSRGEKRIKIKTAGDIAILNRGLVVEYPDRILIKKKWSDVWLKRAEWLLKRPGREFL